MPNLREISKQNFVSKEGEIFNALTCGSLQRIADATEVMAKNYTALQNDMDWYKKRYKEKSESVDKLYRRISALKGVITKLKNKQPC